MRIGCFALIRPFSGMATQLQLIRDIGIENADLTDNHDAASLGAEYGFAASVSLDSHPANVRRLAEEAGIRLSAICAHANLLDPPSPDVYSTHQIIKAIRLAHLLGIKHVITAEGEPKTEFGRQLTYKERLFAIRERLYEPIRWAEELGVELLLETHGPVTDSVDGMADLLDTLRHDGTVGVCLDTGNSWLGGADPLEYVRWFPRRIKHVHWKDMEAEWIPKRGTLFGCGMAAIALGDGVIDIAAIARALRQAQFQGDTTIEVAGVENLRRSVERLKRWLADSVPADRKRHSDSASRSRPSTPIEPCS
jgi:inosose dehydratase